MKYKDYKAGCSILEIPIIFPDREHGISKMPKKIIDSSAWRCMENQEK
jgi:hypothetical protein